METASFENILDNQFLNRESIIWFLKMPAAANIFYIVNFWNTWIPLLKCILEVQFVAKIEKIPPAAGYLANVIVFE